VDQLNSAKDEVRRVTLWALASNLMLSACKFIFGIIGESQALVADGVHSLSDSVTDIAVLVGAQFWLAPADSDHPYGHGRIETMVTLAIGIVLAGVGVGMSYRAIATLHEQHPVFPGWTAFATACVAIVGKEALYRWTVRVGKRIRSHALVANAWHQRSDALSSVPVAVAVLGTQIWPSLGFLDHIATVLVSVLVLHAAWQIVWPALNQLADTGVDESRLNEILSIASHVEGVRGVHSVRTRQTGADLQIDLHILVDAQLTVYEGHRIADALEAQLLSAVPEALEVLVHVDPDASIVSPEES